MFPKVPLDNYWNKTNTMGVSKNSSRILVHKLSIQVDSLSLGQSERHKYQDTIVINQDEGCTVEIKTRIERANYTFMNEKNLIMFQKLGFRN